MRWSVNCDRSEAAAARSRHLPVRGAVARWARRRELADVASVHRWKESAAAIATTTATMTATKRAVLVLASEVLALADLALADLDSADLAPAVLEVEDPTVADQADVDPVSARQVLAAPEWLPALVAPPAALDVVLVLPDPAAATTVTAIAAIAIAMTTTTTIATSVVAPIAMATKTMRSRPRTERLCPGNSCGPHDGSGPRPALGTSFAERRLNCDLVFEPPVTGPAPNV